MGGWGSSRWAGYQRKTRVEECLPLSADSFRKYAPGSRLTISFGETNSILAYKNIDNLVLHYTVNSSQQNVEEVVQLVQPTGRRWYFICPDCNRFAGKLYKPHNRHLFRCRLCHNLSYQSVQERGKYERLARQFAALSGDSIESWERFLKSY